VGSLRDQGEPGAATEEPQASGLRLFQSGGEDLNLRPLRPELDQGTDDGGPDSE
jgi:hypothetical protein